jgi:hypothetical protein
MAMRKMYTLCTKLQATVFGTRIVSGALTQCWYCSFPPGPTLLPFLNTGLAMATPLHSMSGDESITSYSIARDCNSLPH